MNEKHKALKKLVGGWAYRALCRGAPLQVWRRSSPHNWFIENAKRNDYLWHSDDPPRSLPDLSLFEHVEDSKSLLPIYWGGDSGMSELSLYRLKVEE
jgi:hypothetical protein